MSHIEWTGPALAPRPVAKIGKAERTRSKILNAAAALLWTRPFREMTVGELMSSAGSSRATFYRYFADLHDLMQALLGAVQEDIFVAAEPWLVSPGDPVALLDEALGGLVRTCHERGPFLRAAFDAAGHDSTSSAAWEKFLVGFDEAARARIEADQQQGLIPDLDARSVAFALNRLDAYTLVDTFGRHPRSDPEPVRQALAQIWISTLYGSEWAGKGASTLVRR